MRHYEVSNTSYIPVVIKKYFNYKVRLKNVFQFSFVNYFGQVAQNTKYKIF